MKLFRFLENFISFSNQSIRDFPQFLNLSKIFSKLAYFRLSSLFPEFWHKDTHLKCQLFDWATSIFCLVTYPTRSKCLLSHYSHTFLRSDRSVKVKKSRDDCGLHQTIREWKMKRRWRSFQLGLILSQNEYFSPKRLFFSSFRRRLLIPEVKCTNSANLPYCATLLLTYAHFHAIILS